MNKSTIKATHIDSQKIEPKLRMYANCDQEVNAVRAIQNGNLTVQKNVQPDFVNKTLENAISPTPFTKDLVKKPLKNPSQDISTNVFIAITPEASNTAKKIKGEIIRKGNIVASKVALTDLENLSKSKDVVAIELPRILKLAEPVITKSSAKKPANGKWTDLRKKYPANNEVMIGIIDVGGFDFAHEDFLDANGKTRFIKIWDQGGNFRKPPKNFSYGSEFDNTILNNAIKNAKTVGVPATRLEKQSAVSIGSHGTHVASIAAGNSGVFPTAKIAGVLIALTEGDLDRRKSFYDSASIVYAVNYLLEVAREENLPISINISLGTNGHAHDGSDASSRWIDAELTLPGRCVSIAAGNAGQEKALSKNDLGFTMGRIHSNGKIEATGLSKDISWTVTGNGISDVSENEMEVWYEPQDRISIMIKPPGGDWIGPVKPNEFVENKQLPDGSYISIYNDLYHFANGNNYIGIYLSPNLKKADNIIPVKAGNWLVRLKGEEIRNGEYNAWIERDDPKPLGASGKKENWNFPSFLAGNSNTDNTSISSLACARYVIAVGNCDLANEKISISSSQGPTKDKRNKPEVIAPGTNITAAKGFSSEDDAWTSMTGTSMASPYVCGIAAWMMSLDRNLSASQVQGIMIRTSTPLPGDGYAWNDDTGFGLINPSACLEEAKIIRTKKEIK
ncbi:MAG: S8 family serine peptidase [Ferruginibacter sp.]